MSSNEFVIMKKGVGFYTGYMSESGPILTGKVETAHVFYGREQADGLVEAQFFKGFVVVPVTLVKP